MHGGQAETLLLQKLVRTALVRGESSNEPVADVTEQLVREPAQSVLPSNILRQCVRHASAAQPLTCGAWSQLKCHSLAVWQHEGIQPERGF